MTSVSIAGIDYHYVDRGSGPPLLFVHGFPLSHQMWNAQVDRFSATHRVIVPDLRGFGRTAAADDQVMMQRFADDLAALLDHLDIAQVNYCGLSMGGYIAWQFAAHHADRLQRLVVCDTRAEADPPQARDGRLTMAARVLIEGAASVADGLIDKIFAPANVAANATCVQETRDVICATRPKAIAAAQRGMAARPDMVGSLANIGVPTLVVCGELDAISPPEAMRNIATAIPDASYVEISGAGHMAPLEDPQPVNDALAAFLEA